MSPLRPYQEAAAEFLADPSFLHRGRLLADPPGFGKSRSALAGAKRRYDLKLAGYQPIVVICPAMARRDWLREAKTFWPELPSYIVTDDEPSNIRKGETKEQFNTRRIEGLEKILLDRAKPTLILCSYQSSDKLLALVEKHDLLLGTVIADEAHALKKAGNITTTVVRQLIARGEKLFLLTGTPIHNRPIDLHNLLDLCAPGKFGSRYTLAKRYFQMHVPAGGNALRSTIGRLLDREGLKIAISPFVLARSVADAFGELPPRIRKLLPVDTKGKALAQRIDTLTEGQLSLKLRQSVQFKVPVVVKLATEELLDEPLVIYTFERAHARLIAGKLLQKGESVIVATGDATPKQRDKLVDSWKNGAARILVCTMDAVKESATLTRAAALIFADLDHLPGKMLQVEGRIDPARQPEKERRPARYYYVVCDGGFDQVVAERVIEKIEDAQGVVGSKDMNADGLRNVLLPLTPPVEPVGDLLADLVERINTRAARMESIR